MSQRLNLLAPEVNANPYAFYVKLRKESPVCQVEPNGLWVISKYDDIISAFKNTQVFSSAGLRMATAPPWLKRHNPITDSMVLLDPPKHTRLRALVNRAFSTSILNQMESYARDVSERLGEMLLQQGEVDFVADFAVGLPACLLAMVMGLDPSMQKTFKRWADDINRVAVLTEKDAEHLAQVRKTLDEMEAYLKDVLASRRRKLGDDLVSELIQARVDGEALTDDELMAFFSLMLVAGLETTTFLLANAAMILAQQPELMDRLRDNATLTPPFIEEVLRCQPPIHSTLRLVMADTQVRGVSIPAHSTALLLVGSGLRDEEHFPDPERFDPERGAQANLAFGYGVHFCLGAPLARMEARVALDTLLSMCARFEPRFEQLQWSRSLTARALVSLPLKMVPF
jgi:cytochrome P450